MESTYSQKTNSGSLYWQSTMSQVPSYPSINKRETTHVAVLGGGMTGALCTSLLAREGLPCMLIEKQRVADVAMESNTGLLQFCNGRLLTKLAETIGETEAVRFYGECRKALKSLAELSYQLPSNTGFHRRSSMYFASTLDDVPRLFKEYSTLRKHGFSVEWGSPHNAGHQLPIQKPAALVTHGDADINPLRFAHSLIAKAKSLGAHIFENSPVIKVERHLGRFVISTDSGEIIANYIVIAGGSLPDFGIPTARINQVMRHSCTIATAADSLPAGWPYDCMMRETALPYFFFRTTPDGRIIAGNSDEVSPGPITDRRLANRTSSLLSELSRLFPNNKWEAEYSWSGTYYESKDDLPYLGESPGQPGIFHALGCGGNGTVFSMIVAEMLLNQLLGREHPLHALLTGERPELSSGKKPSFKESY